MQVEDPCQGFIYLGQERLHDDYIQHYKPNTCMVMQTKAWMINFLFKKLVPSAISLTNRHLVVLDGHKFHVILKAIEQAQAFGLNMIILPSHTSHALQPLDVACFKPFKTTFLKRKHVLQLLVIIIKNHIRQL
jgi:hypothetical protein